MKPNKPTPDFPLFPHASGQWAKKVGGKTVYYGPWSDPAAALVRYKGSTKIARPDKPAKPRPDFPLYPHAVGQWAKKILGRVHYFGPWSDPEAALSKYLKGKDDLHAGRKPSTGTGLAVGALVKEFLASKERLVDNGERSPRTLHDYQRACDKVKEVFGETRPVATLRPEDFTALRAAFAATHGLVALGKDVTQVRVLFKYALDNELIERRTVLGPDFKRPDKKALRKQRREKGKRMFQPKELRAIIDKAGVQLRAMIYLGINCGLGNHDCEMLPRGNVNLDAAFHDFPRPKTEILRRCPLWPETVEALRAALAARPTPKAKSDRVFITKFGTTWEPKSISDNPVSKAFTKILKSLGLHRPGLGFYALRHTFQTIGQQSRDKDAVRYVMGHAEESSDMSAIYSEEAPDDARLQAVVNYVRAWLLS